MIRHGRAYTMKFEDFYDNCMLPLEEECNDAFAIVCTCLTAKGGPSVRSSRRITPVHRLLPEIPCALYHLPDSFQCICMHNQIPSVLRLDPHPSPPWTLHVIPRREAVRTLDSTRPSLILKRVSGLDHSSHTLKAYLKPVTA
jgi:hypothetical protein